MYVFFTEWLSNCLLEEVCTRLKWCCCHSKGLPNNVNKFLKNCLNDIRKNAYQVSCHGYKNVMPVLILYFNLKIKVLFMGI